MTIGPLYKIMYLQLQLETNTAFTQHYDIIIYFYLSVSFYCFYIIKHTMWMAAGKSRYSDRILCFVFNSLLCCLSPWLQNGQFIVSSFALAYHVFTSYSIPLTVYGLKISYRLFWFSSWTLLLFLLQSCLVGLFGFQVLIVISLE